MDNNLIKVFWSCGFDSTYLVCDLVLKGYTVQPFYLKNCKTKDWKRIERRNQDKEISLFPKLSEKINEIGPDKILDVVTIEAEEYKSEECSEILSRYHEIFSKEHQYSYLSNYCFQTNQIIAIGLENVPKPKGSVGPWLKDFVGLHGEYLECRPNDNILKKNPDLKIIMNWRFPITHMKKIELAIDSIHRGFHSILKETTFCRLSEEACGKCGKCKTHFKCVNLPYNLYDISGIVIKDSGNVF